MSDSLKHAFSLPPDQQAIRNKCFHPSGSFVEFSEEEIEQSIPERFEKIVQRYPDQLAVKMGDCALAYTELNKAANRMRERLECRGSQPGPIVSATGRNYSHRRNSGSIESRKVLRAG